MNFSQFILLNESDLEDLYVSDDPTENIELLHEMEWKLGQIIDNQYKLNPKMYVNIIKRFSNFAFESYDDLSIKFDKLFEYWLEIHAIEDPKVWAETLYDSQEEHIELNGMAGAGGVSVSKDDIIEGMSNSELEDMIINEFGTIDDAFPDDHHRFLASIEAVPDITPEELEEYSEPWEFWEEYNDEAIDYIRQHDLEDQFTEYAIDSFRDSISTDSGGYEISREAWIKGIANLLYPEYYAVHGYAIESVTPDIEEAKERLILTDDLIKDSDSIMAKLHPDDVNLDKNVERLQKMVGRAASAISLSMNVVHTSGNVMTDYGHVAGLADVDSEFLTGFNEREIDDWRVELRQIIR